VSKCVKIIKRHRLKLALNPDTKGPSEGTIESLLNTNTFERLTCQAKCHKKWRQLSFPNSSMELQRSSVPGMMNRLGDEDGRSSTYPDLQEIKEGGGCLVCT
jgi:hypothetical protein